MGAYQTLRDAQVAGNDAGIVRRIDQTLTDPQRSFDLGVRVGRAAALLPDLRTPLEPDAEWIAGEIASLERRANGLKRFLGWTEIDFSQAQPGDLVLEHSHENPRIGVRWTVVCEMEGDDPRPIRDAYGFTGPRKPMVYKGFCPLTGWRSHTTTSGHDRCVKRAWRRADAVAAVNGWLEKNTPEARK